MPLIAQMLKQKYYRDVNCNPLDDTGLQLYKMLFHHIHRRITWKILNNASPNNAKTTQNASIEWD